MLTTPLTLPSGLRLQNRVAKSAMDESLADPSGLPSPALLTLYRRWAHSGAGLMITGNIALAHEGVVRPGDVVITDETPLAPFQRWAEAARAGGTPVIVQMNHAGRQAMRFVDPRPLAPSEARAVKMWGAFGKPRAATEEEIREIIRRFGAAARLLEAAGFDGVQVHAAHGYLLNQFLSPLTNLRTDAWGGSVEGRARLLLESVREVRRRVSARFTVAVKLNSADFQRGGFSEEESLQVVQLLEGEGVDLLEISGGNYEAPASFGHVKASTASREAYFLDFVRKVRQVSRLPLMLTGGFRSRAAMDAALEEGALDVVGIARPMAVEPDLPRRLLAYPTASAKPPRAPRVELRALAGLSELGWYSRQLERMGAGLEPDPEMSPWAAAFWYAGVDFLRASRRRRPVAPLLPVGTAA